MCSAVSLVSFFFLGLPYHCHFRATVINSADSTWLRVQGVGQGTFPAFSAICCFLYTVNASQVYVGSGLFLSSYVPLKILSLNHQCFTETWEHNECSAPPRCSGRGRTAAPSVYLVWKMPDQPDWYLVIIFPPGHHFSHITVKRVPKLNVTLSDGLRKDICLPLPPGSWHERRVSSPTS